MSVFRKVPETGTDSMFVGMASQMQIHPVEAVRLMRAMPGDALNMSYTVYSGNMEVKADVKITLTLDDPHKLLGEKPTMFDVLSLLISQCAAARLD